MTRDAYITGCGSYLPGDPLDNDESVRRLGATTDGRAAKVRERVLAANGMAASRDDGARRLHCDVPRAVYEHAVLCEYAHAHLRTIAGRGTPAYDAVGCAHSAHSHRRLQPQVMASRSS